MTKLAVKYVLLDIEGTVLPITFVKDVLFVYARQHVESFLEENWSRTEVQEAIQEIRQFATKTPGSPAIDGAGDRLGVVSNVLWQMDRDLKTAGLKALQGLIWDTGYRKGELVGELYPDVYPALTKWHQNGIKIGIYSSGSIFAQRLLFGHTKDGSLLEMLDSFHDLTSAGPKLDASSYSSIAAQISCSPDSVLFLTDVYGEYAAARAARMLSSIVVRDGNKPLSEDEKKDVQLITSFDQLQLC